MFCMQAHFDVPWHRHGLEFVLREDVLFVPFSVSDFFVGRTEVVATCVKTSEIYIVSCVLFVLFAFVLR